MRDSERFYIPGTAAKALVDQDRRQTVEGRKEVFASLNRLVTDRPAPGWLTSIPGNREITMQCLVDSDLPDELAKGGYDDIEMTGTAERILPSAIIETFVRIGDDLVPLTPGSSRPIAATRSHAGLTVVEEWRFSIP